MTACRPVYWMAADDFGCGYSSLSLMRMLPFDYIKIDQTFVCKILESEGDQFLVEAIISCAQKLGIQVCVEGVENEEVFAFMKGYGAEAYQGYYFARPMPVDLLKELNYKV